MRAGSLFSGCGGLDLAVERFFGAGPAWLCEADPHCRTVLERHWPGVSVLGDVREVDAGVPPVDVLHGGYPCQPFSVAGKRQGERDPRHLWPEFARLIRVLRPRLAILENVPGHLALGFGSVLGDLAEAGYDTRWVCVRASDVGAPHRRERLFVVARPRDADDLGREGRESEPRGDIGGARRVAADADEHGLARLGRQQPERRDLDGRGGQDVAWGAYESAIHRWEHVLRRPAPRPTDDRGRLMPEFVEWMMALPEGWTDGVKRTHRLRMLGNAVVWPQAVLALGELVGGATE